MNTTIKIRDNYSNKLRDDVSAELKGIVDIQVRNKITGQIEETHRHNMIVYGGREWLLRRAFGNALSGDNDSMMNSCIKWVGFGQGGGEPGNPMQSGCTLGNDTDLYSPVRIRYVNDNNNPNLNQFYASRMLSNGEIVSGYYKQISYVTLKEDSANPYVENGVIHYPQLIAELRIEMSSDDCNGPNYSNLNNNVAYQDINEAALFISSDDAADPAMDTSSSTINIIPSGSNHKFIYDENVPITSMVNHVGYNGADSGTEVEDDWSKIEIDEYPVNKSQFFNFKYEDSNLNTEPVFIGFSTTNLSTIDTCKIIIEKTEVDEFRGIKITSQRGTDVLAESFIELDEEQYETIFLNHINIVSAGTIWLHYQNKFNKSNTNPVFDTVQYRNTYNQPWTIIAEPYSFVTKNDSEDTYAPNDKQDCYLYIPYYYSIGEKGELIKLGEEYAPFTGSSTIRVVETVNRSYPIKISGFECDANSYKVKVYLYGIDETNHTEKFSIIKEGMKFYVPDENDKNCIPRTQPATILEVYDPFDDTQVLANMHRPYFVIERSNISNEDYSIYDPEYRDGVIYEDSNYEPYKMFSRVTFSTIRKTTDRELVFLWKIYF